MLIKSKFKIILSIIYYFALLGLYPSILDLFNYMWKIEYEFNTINFIFSLITIIVISVYINFKSFGYSLISGLFYFLIIPSMCISTITNYGYSFFYIIASTISTLLLLNIFSKKVIVTPKLYFSKRLKLALNIFFILLILLMLLNNINNFNLFSLLSDVYSFREDNIQSGILSYVLFWVQSVFVFWILIKSFFDSDKIKLSYLIIALFFGYLSFMITGLKTGLFTPIFMIVVFSFLKYSKSKLFGFVMSYVYGLLILGYVFSNLITLAIIDRVLYLPSLLNLRYIDFFGKNPLYYFKGSKLEIFFLNKSNYNDIPGHLIDAAYGGGGMNANTGAFGSIYSDIGIIGILLIFPLFICLIDLIIRSISKDLYLNSLLGIYYSFIIVNSPPTDIILTHGLVIHLIILYFRKNKLILKEFNIQM